MNLLMFNLKTDADDTVLGFTTAWIAAMARRWDHVSVITMQAGRIEVPSNVEVYSLGKEFGHSEAHRAAIFYAHLARILSYRRIHGCFSHMIPIFSLLAGPVTRVSGIPHVLWYSHASPSLELRASLPFVDRIVTSTRTACRLDSAKVRAIGHGIPIPGPCEPSTEAPDGRTFRLLYVGRISRIKRLDILIDAVHLLAKDQPCDVRVVGDAAMPSDRAYRTEIEARIAERGLADHFSFLGPVPWRDLLGHYRWADATINPCETASLDKVGLESMAAGTPVITGNQSLRAHLPADLSGLLVATPNAPATYASRLLTLRGLDRGRRQQLATAMRAVVAHDHSIDGLAGKVTHAIHGLRTARSHRIGDGR